MFVGFIRVTTLTISSMTHGKDHFQDMYQRRPPWDIDHPQPAFVGIADRIEGSVLDAGCGTGENALYLAQRGHTVYRIDFLEGPITKAEQKAKERGLDARFLVMDVLALTEIPPQFDNVVDCGLFHVFSDGDRAAYVATRKGPFPICGNDDSNLAANGI
jgi:2-polyprenyl-3-methyl-5-hydroxy-6-metoxy-1,4-benzoquinol methylase